MNRRRRGSPRFAGPGNGSDFPAAFVVVIGTGWAASGASRSGSDAFAIDNVELIIESN